jgi:hypothetical protein
MACTWLVWVVVLGVARIEAGELNCDESAQYMHAVVRSARAAAWLWPMTWCALPAPPPPPPSLLHPGMGGPSCRPLCFAEAFLHLMVPFAWLFLSSHRHGGPPVCFPLQARMIQDNNLPSAMQLSQQAVSRHPQCSESFMTRGATLFTVGRLEEAILSFEQVGRDVWARSTLSLPPLRPKLWR